MNLIFFACTGIMIYLFCQKLKMELFNRKKYIAFVIVLLILFAGFFLMAGPEPSKDHFNTEMFNFRRITLAPVLILLSYSGMIYLILKKK